MCPVCLTTAALVVAGAASVGGLTALAALKLRAARGARVVVTFKPRGDDAGNRSTRGVAGSPPAPRA